jgi:polyribonucleotide nucleotidyltransferase
MASSSPIRLTTSANESDLDLVYVGTENDVIMIEGAANEMPEEDFIKALEFAHGHAKEMIRIQKELAARSASRSARCR